MFSVLCVVLYWVLLYNLVYVVNNSDLIYSWAYLYLKPKKFSSLRLTFCGLVCHNFTVTHYPPTPPALKHPVPSHVELGLVGNGSDADLAQANGVCDGISQRTRSV